MIDPSDVSIALNSNGLRTYSVIRKPFFEWRGNDFAYMWQILMRVGSDFAYMWQLSSG